jgi:hypothetical protein
MSASVPVLLTNGQRKSDGFCADRELAQTAEADEAMTSVFLDITPPIT